MPLTAAAGPISNVEQLAATTLANCKEFQTLTGSADADEAAESIYFDALPPPADSDEHTLAELQAYRPFAILATDDGDGFRWRHDGSGPSDWVYRTGGSLLVQLEKDIATGDLDDAQEYMRLWKNTLGKIVQSLDDNNPGLLELAGQSGYLAIREVVLHGPWRSAEERRQGEGDYVWAVLEIRWGRV